MLLNARLLDAVTTPVWLFPSKHAAEASASVTTSLDLDDAAVPGAADPHVTAVAALVVVYPVCPVIAVASADVSRLNVRAVAAAALTARLDVAVSRPTAAPARRHAATLSESVTVMTAPTLAAVPTQNSKSPPSAIRTAASAA